MKNDARQVFLICPINYIFSGGIRQLVLFEPSLNPGHQPKGPASSLQPLRVLLDLYLSIHPHTNGVGVGLLVHSGAGSDGCTGTNSAGSSPYSTLTTTGIIAPVGSLKSLCPTALSIDVIAPLWAEIVK